MARTVNKQPHMTNTSKSKGNRNTHAMEFSTADEIALAHALIVAGDVASANVILKRHGFRAA